MICKKKKYSISRHAYYATMSAKPNVTFAFIHKRLSYLRLREVEKVHVGGGVLWCPLEKADHLPLAVAY